MCRNLRGCQRLRVQFDLAHVAHLAARGLLAGPIVDDLHRVLREGILGAAALDLAARGLADLAALDEHDAGHLQAQSLEHLRHDCLARAGAILALHAIHVHLLYDDDVVGAVREGGDATLAHAHVCLLRHPLDVLRVEVGAVHDDHVLEAAGDEELAVAGVEAQVAGAQPAVRKIALHTAVVRRLRGVLVLPVAEAHRGAAHPQLADGHGGLLLARLGVDDDDLVVQPRPALRHNAAHVVLGEVVLLRLDDAVAVELVHLEQHVAGVGLHEAVGDDERGLCEAVAGVEGRARERRERVAEAVDSCHLDGLRAAEGDAPRAQVVLCALLGRGLAHDEVEGEVGAAGERAAVLGHGGEPLVGVLQEHLRRHEVEREAEVHGAQHAADETEVVEHGQPAHAHLLLAHLAAHAEDLQVVAQVVVRDHDALGCAGAAARVLQEADAVTVDVDGAPRLRRRHRDRVGGHEREWGELRHGLERGGLLVDGGGGQHDGGLRVLHDGDEAREQAIHAGGVRRVRRHRDDAGVDAAEEGHDEVQRLCVEEHGAVALLGRLLELGGDGARAHVQFGVGQ
eukprot:PhM_4_TR13889/c1_g1_i1/m.56482